MCECLSCELVKVKCDVRFCNKCTEYYCMDCGLCDIYKDDTTIERTKAFFIQHKCAKNFNEDGICKTCINENLKLQFNKTTISA